ncbi:lipopolysaccharide biosynthesis protein [uncultured Sphingomonas sp.]|uniref:lipopolysaccharide biosynthesis protein n=1 Tax=uncultured Sphingomonas sp. TaxID=158754 RepID=UPI0035C9D776
MTAIAPPSSRPPERFARTIRRAVIWRSGSQIVAQLVQWTATFLVIRILTPADYGLFAMTQVVLVFLNILNGYGLASGVVQRPNVSRREIAQLFGMLILVNVTLAVVQIAAAPLVAAYYRQPSVADLLRVQALLYLATPFVALPQALLARGMEFSRQAKVNIAASLAGAATALGGASAGLGVWTLVWAPMALFAVRGTLLTIAAGGLPRPVFDFRSTRGLVRYGGLMATGQFVTFLWSQSDIFIAGRYFSAHELGLYTTSLFLVWIFVSKVAPPLHDVAFAAYSRLQHDPDARARAFLQFARVFAVAAMPFHLGLAATAEPLVLTVLGEQWAGAAPVVRVLACSLPFYAIYVLLGPAADAVGRPDIGPGNALVAALLAPPLLLVGVRWGAVGLAASWAAVFPVLLAIGLRRVLPVIGVELGALVRVFAPPLAAALAMAVAVTIADATFARAFPPASRLAALVALGGAAYGGWMLLFARPALVELWALARAR